MQLGLLLSLMLHAAGMAIILHGSRRETPAPENVITVNLLASHPSIAAMPAPAAGARSRFATDDESDALGPRAIVDAVGMQHSGDDGHAQSKPARSAVRARRIAKSDVHGAQPVPFANPPVPKAADVENRAKAASNDYLAELAHRLASVEQYPPPSVARGEEGVVVVSLRLDRDGHVIAWEIATSAGYRNLDEAVAEMIRSATFPPFPADWAQVDATFLVPIRFSLR